MKRAFPQGTSFLGFDIAGSEAPEIVETEWLTAAPRSEDLPGTRHSPSALYVTERAKRVRRVRIPRERTAEQIRRYRSHFHLTIFAGDYLPRDVSDRVECGPRGSETPEAACRSGALVRTYGHCIGEQSAFFSPYRPR